MKLFKKAAALFFCLALALSVMAVTALAADGDPVFTVTLSQNTTEDTHTNHNGDDVAEYLNSATVVYDIKLSADKAVTVNALDFAVNVDSGLTIAKVEVGPVGSLVEIHKGASTNTGNTGAKYTYAADYYSKAKFTLSASTPQVIGKLTLTVGDSTAATAGSFKEFSLTDVSISETAIQLAAYTGDSVVITNAKGKIEVDPVYNIYVKRPQTNDAGVISNSKTLETTADFTSTYTLLTGTNGAGITNGNNIAGYHLTDSAKLYAMASENGVGNWTEDYVVSTNGFSNTAVSNNSEIAIAEATEAQKGLHWGDLTLRADYTATEYQVTFDLNDKNSAATNTQFTQFNEAKFNITDTNNDGVLTYTIETVATDNDYFGVPTRNGYVFNGWKATAISYVNSDLNDTTTNDTSDYYTFWTDNGIYYYDTTPSDNNDDTVYTTGAFGNVTLTAQWAIDGYFVQKNYKYAVSGELLTLFAVETSKVEGGVYYFGSSPSAMYIVDNAYESMFEDLPSGTYTVFGTIAGAVADNATDYTITYKSSATKGTDVNTPIVYNGKITGDAGTVINSGDFGTVDLLFASQSAYNNDTVSIAQRLAANVVRTGANVTPNGGGTAAYWCGTIDDIGKIMDLAGTTASTTSIALASASDPTNP